MTLTKGTRLGVYEIEALLGAGGMGQVYRARDSKLERDVAIKVLPSSLSADSERLARFEREARLLAALEHPHVAAIYGIEDTTDVRALVLELVDGETLARRLSGSALPISEALRLAMQIAEALAAAHARGIVHRDLKPANVMITSAGIVKVLLDFPTARPSRTRCPPLMTYTVMSTKPWLSTWSVVRSSGSVPGRDGRPDEHAARNSAVATSINRIAAR